MWIALFLACNPGPPDLDHTERVVVVGEACLAEVPRWDFDWQQLYLLEEPRYLFPDEVIEVTCTFDTTDDVTEVTWGEGTGDEMCLVGLLVTLS